MLQIIHHTSDGFTWCGEHVVATFYLHDKSRAEQLVTILKEFLGRKHRMFDDIELRTADFIGPNDNLNELADQFYSRL